jgi:hypothetical protein
MPDFSKGKVYKITSGELTYIGSTTEPTLAKRLAKHVSDYRLWKNGGRRYISSFQLIEVGQYEIALLELCPCGSRDELRMRERFHIDTNICVNQRVEGRTPKEWYEANKNVVSEKQKIYREEHKDQIKEYLDTNKEVIQERQAKYREEHREQAKACFAVYREANKNVILEKAKAYREANRDKIYTKQRERQEQQKTLRLKNLT